MIQVVLRGQGSVDAGIVYAIGRNYAEHAREMGVKAEPVVFLKPTTALQAGGGLVPWPRGSALVHHEVELALLLSRGGRDLSLAEAEDAVGGVAIALDLTARDLQAEAKKNGAPWARAKGFPGSAPVSDFVDPRKLGVAWDALDLSLEIDGEVRQQGTSAAMILSIPELVQVLSQWFALEAGDVVLTGTPEGVGPLAPGQRAVARSRALEVMLECRMAEPIR